MKFNGQLNANLIYGSLRNMIISQDVMADGLSGLDESLVNSARVNGSMYGDTKLYYSPWPLETVDFVQDSKDALNVLAVDRARAPETQAIVLNKFRQIRLTTDAMMTKQAWADAEAYTKFISVMKGYLAGTKKIYDYTTYNAYVGTVETDIGEQTDEIVIPEGATLAQAAAEKLANIIINVQDITSDYNDYMQPKSYNKKGLKVIWNAKYYNSIKKIDEPVIFHNSGLLGDLETYVLPERFFGNVVGTEGTSTTDSGNYEALLPIRSLIEKSYKVASLEADPRAVEKTNEQGVVEYWVHCWAGDILPNNVVFNQNEAYYEKENIAFKVIHKRSIPYMGAYTRSGVFNNEKNNSTNDYLTYGHNTLTYLKDRPMITVKYNG